MVYLLYGEADFLAQAELRRLKASLGDDEMLELNTMWLAGNQLGYAELEAAANTVPFLAPARLVVVEGLFARFDRLRSAVPSGGDDGVDSDDKAPAGRGRSRRGGLGDWERLPDLLKGLPDTTQLVFLEGELARNNQLLPLVVSLARVQKYDRLRGAPLAEWVRQQAIEEGAAISPAAVRRLTDTAGDNLWVLHSELQKLALYAAGGAIEPAHVDALVSEARETTIFALIDAMVGRQLPAAQRSLHQLLIDGAAPTYVLFMLARQVRTLLLAKALLDKDVKGPELMRRIGVTNDWAFRKTIDQARSHTRAGLEGMLRRLLDTDVAMKTGKEEPDAALELLVTELCRA